MLALNLLSKDQKSQISDVFRLIDGESRDSEISKQDLVNVYKSIGLAVPLDRELDNMLTVDSNKNDKEKKLNFNSFLNIMALELQKLDDKMTIYNALKFFPGKTDDNGELSIDLKHLKEAVCSVHTNSTEDSNQTFTTEKFDALVQGFLKTQVDGNRVFLASKWVDAYIS